MFLSHIKCSICRLHSASLLPVQTFGPQQSRLNPVDYYIWEVMQERIYQTQVYDVEEVRQCLIDVWHGLGESVINDAIDEWRKRLRACVCAKGGHFEHLI